MAQNYNRINLDIIPVGGVDKSIQCSDCPSACCREGMVIPLTKPEAQMMQANGTDMRPVDTKGEFRARAALLGTTLYRLESDCANLSIDPETGTSSCSIYNTPEFPKACRKFTMGSAACAITQTTRVGWGQDEFVTRPQDDSDMNP